MHPFPILTAAFLLIVSHLTMPHLTRAADTEDAAPVFSSPTVDIGIVASDLDKSVAFYRDALGLTEIKGFTATAEKATAFGLTDHVGADIRVFVLGEGDGATKLKLMSFPEKPGAKPDQAYIHSTVGISYLTMRVSDMAAALARLKSAGVELLGECPVALSGTTYFVAVKDPDGNFIELIGPMPAN